MLGFSKLKAQKKKLLKEIEELEIEKKQSRKSWEVI